MRPVPPLGCHLHCCHRQWSVVFNEGGKVAYSQSILWDPFLFTGLSLSARYCPTALRSGWVILLLVSFYLLCYNSACPTFPQFFSISHFLCPRDTNIISPFVLPPLLQFRIDCSLPKGSFLILSQSVFIAPY
uniref:Uncharacterized protein n=1 Tax=Sus scrofa TaxID=9823 RepID=A0A4X1SGY8_PIG